jgi:hypothetical protein
MVLAVGVAKLLCSAYNRQKLLITSRIQAFMPAKKYGLLRGAELKSELHNDEC